MATRYLQLPFTMSTKDGFPRLDPEVAAIVSSFPAPAPGPWPTVQEIRASENTYFVEARKWQSEVLPKGTYSIVSV